MVSDNAPQQPAPLGVVWVAEMRDTIIFVAGVMFAAFLLKESFTALIIMLGLLVIARELRG